MVNLPYTHPFGRLEEDIDGVLAFLGKEMFRYCDFVQKDKDVQFRFWLNQRTPEMVIGISQAPGKKLRIPITLANKLKSYELSKLLLIFDHLIICQDSPFDRKLIKEQSLAFIKSDYFRNDIERVLLRSIATIGDFVIFTPILPSIPGLDKNNMPDELLAGPIAQYVVLADTTEINGIKLAEVRRVGESWQNNPSWTFYDEYRELIENGMVVIGGTIFGKDYDQELLSYGVDFSKFYGPILSASSDSNICGLDIKKAQALLKLDIPVLKGIKCNDLSKIINDDPVSFNKFRSYLSEGLNQIEDSKDSYDFGQKVKIIKKEIIDDGINELAKQYNRIRKLRSFRAAGYTIGAIGLWASIYINIPEVAKAFAIGSPLAISVQEKIKRIKEEATIEDNPCYFLWLLDQKR